MMENKVVFSGHQPCFLPYMGFFYKMFQSDVFVLDDDVQYSTKSFQNSNFIKVNGAKHRVTVPVSYVHGDAINEVRIGYARNWDEKLLKTLKMSYGKAPHFDEVYSMMEDAIMEKYEYLSDLNIHLLLDIKERLGLKCNVVIASRDVPTTLKNNERNLFQCCALGADIYYSGVGGKAYNDEIAYRKRGIGLVYSDYEPVVYRQLGGDFIPDLSVLDYLFNEGFTIPQAWVRHI